MRWQWIIAAVFLMCMGCTKQKYAQCAAPNDNLKVLFKAKTANPFSHSFCLVCNPDITPDKYEEWALEMGAPQGPSNVSDVHPCLYVYTGMEKNVDDLAECKSLVCDGTATYSDMVGKKNGNFNVNPILNGSELIAEEWIPVNEEQLLMTTPQSQTLRNNPDPTLQY